LKNILIVDDANFIRMSLKVMLERNGYNVIGEAENGKIAIHKYKELMPDLVTMDITMPEMDGINALKSIRELDPDSKIIMITALGQDPYMKEAILYGAKGFIVKPFKEEYVMQVLSKLW
jgi:two-component system chemotaxis response regulator CheY